MAEGGSPQEKKFINDADTSQCRLLDCPICLEQMLQPKSLPCLHSFCEGCLGTYIVTDLSGEMAAATSFPCPVCRKITSPVDPSKSKETWARQFPTNKLVEAFSYRKKMADYSAYCGPCRKVKRTETLAKYLCRTTEMSFCEACKETFHDVVHEDCDIVPFTDPNLSALQKHSKLTICSTHNETMNCFCEDHKFIGCNKCIVTGHRNCEVVTTTKEFCEKQHTISHLCDVDKSLEKAFNCMELIRKSLDDRDDAMAKCQENNLSSISDLRQRINSHLDKKQEEVTQELISKYKAGKAEVDVFRQKCSRLKVSIQNTRDASRMASQMEDHAETIQLLHRGQTEIGACNDLIEEISSSKVYTIKHDVESGLDTIDQNSPFPLGRIIVEEESCSIPDDHGVEFVQNHAMHSECFAKKIGTFTIKVPAETSNCSAIGILLMSNGNVLISDYQNEYLKLFSLQGECLDILKIDRVPRDMCLVDVNTVAVAVSHGKRGIHIVKIQDCVLTLSNVIDMSVPCFGITFTNGKFMVSSPKVIYRVGMDGKAEQMDTLPNQCYHLATRPNENHTFASMAMSDMNAVVVSKLSTGVQSCVMRVGVVKKAMGIDIDSQRNLYVCGQQSNNVVQVSACGTRIRELLTSKDGIDKPRAISVCGDKFVVSNDSSTDKNNVHVYQLRCF